MSTDPQMSNQNIIVYLERARVSRLWGGKLRYGRRFGYGWDISYGWGRHIRFLIMLLSHISARRRTVILISRGCFLLKKPPTEPLAPLNNSQLIDYLRQLAQQPGNVELRTGTQAWGTLVGCWGITSPVKWIVIATTNRGTFIISAKDVPTTVLRSLGRDFLYYLTGQ